MLPEGYHHSNIHDGGTIASQQHVATAADTTAASSAAATTSDGGGLKPLVKAYGIVGFIRFLDCYYLTLITRRSKVGSIGGNGIYTIKVRMNWYRTNACFETKS